MTNPELRRYAWLEFGWHRVVIVPLVLGALAAIPVVAVAQPAQALAWGAMAVFVVLTMGWGTLRAWASVTEEVRDRTWDAQRMAACSPASLALGKVFGAPLFQWYIGVWCLVLYGVAARRAGLPHVASSLAGAVALAVMLHGIGVAASAASAHAALGQRARRTGGTLLLVFLSNALPIAALFGGPGGERLRWWGVGMSAAVFGAASAVAFAAWAVLGAWRAMARELREPLQHWAWPAFAAFSGMWWAGLALATGPRAPASSGIGIAALVLAIATYAGVTQEPLTPVRLARLRRASRTPDSAEAALDMRGGVQEPQHARPRPHVPGWAIDAVLAVLVGVCAFALSQDGGAFRPGVSDLPSLLAAPVALMALRDAAVVSCFALWWRSRRPVAAATFYIALADILVPAVLTSMGQPLIARLVFPLWGVTQLPAVATVAMAVHAAVAVAVLLLGIGTHGRTRA